MESFLKLSLVGISHQVAPVELRERVSLSLDRASSLARTLGDAVCLSTCNRTEVYLAGDDGTRALAELEELAGSSLDAVAYRMQDEDAAVHLFRVSAGLESLVPGESEILGQVRAAYDASSPGPYLDRVFRQALQLGKRVRTETAIGENPASVPSAAAALAVQVFGDLKGRKVMLVGAGQIGELAAANLAARGATIAYVANRSADGAAALANRFHGSPITLDDVPAKLAEVDVVLTSTSAPGILVSAADIPHRRKHPLFFIDIAVPRDVDPAVHQLDGCFLYDIDDLQAVVAETIEGRRAEAQHAERLIELETERFREWCSSLEVVPAVTALRGKAEEIRAKELLKYESLPEEERQRLEAVTSQILNKLLHLPTIRMKEAAGADHGRSYAEAVRHLFGLDERKTPE